MKELSVIRREYTLKSLNKKDVNTDPFRQFGNWMNDAVKCKVNDPTAMTLATSGSDNKPSARIVLLKKFDAAGFVFFTNYNSKKGKQLLENNNAALLFFWSELEREIRIEGKAVKVREEESVEYFDSRPEKSRISAIISPQSQPVDNREYLESLRKKYEPFGNTKIEKPGFWGGYRIVPELFEFWQGREDRLHDRIQYKLENGNWKIERLGP